MHYFAFAIPPLEWPSAWGILVTFANLYPILGPLFKHLLHHSQPFYENDGLISIKAG
jgi:hypothetical protein